MARIICTELRAGHPHVELAGALIKEGSTRRLPDDVRVTASVAELLSWRPRLVGECAGHSGLAQYGATVLRAGIELVVASVGALADPVLEQSLRSAAREGGTRIRIPSGAVGGLDALVAARLGGLERVRYIGRKPVAAWRGTAAERSVDLSAISIATPVFEGSARDAALSYPQNANVAAAIALAGAGFDDTTVTLIADPAATGNHHAIEAEGRFGRFAFHITGNPMPDNPKTSLLAAYSVLRCLVAPAASIEI